MTQRSPTGRTRSRRGWVALIAILLFAATFLTALVLLTRGKMRPPPPETRTVRER